jgi:hypothetical protein
MRRHGMDGSAILEVAKLVAAGVLGGLITAFVAHRLAASRERKASRASRKTEFLAFMQGWKVEVGRKYLEAGGFSRDEGAFSDLVSTFAVKCALIRVDMTAKRQKRFDVLASEITGFRGGIVNVKGGHEKIEKAFDEIVELVEAG